MTFGNVLPMFEMSEVVLRLRSVTGWLSEVETILERGTMKLATMFFLIFALTLSSCNPNDYDHPNCVNAYHSLARYEQKHNAGRQDINIPSRLREIIDSRYGEGYTDTLNIKITDKDDDLAALGIPVSFAKGGCFTAGKTILCSDKTNTLQPLMKTSTLNEFKITPPYRFEAEPSLSQHPAENQTFWKALALISHETDHTSFLADDEHLDQSCDLYLKNHDELDPIYSFTRSQIVSTTLNDRSLSGVEVLNVESHASVIELATLCLGGYRSGSKRNIDAISCDELIEYSTKLILLDQLKHSGEIYRFAIWESYF